MTVLNCPVCAGAMREVARDGILIDTCTQCRGVWLDRGELEKIAAAVAAPVAQNSFLPRGVTDVRQHRDDRRDDRPAHRYDDDDDYPQQRGQKPSRTKSFLDFFD
jgi:uncharacterized protein